MGVQAIQTSYKQYRFRSRVEARWAVFFDAIGVDYEYEFEGFVLSNGEFYLPDFWLPQVNMWAEVKGKALTDDEKARCKALAKDTRQTVLMLIGTPDYINYTAYEYDPWTDDAWEIDFTLINRYVESESRFPGGGYVTNPSEYSWPDSYCNAVEAARSARFEHGETP